MAQNLNYPINRAGGPVDDRTEVQHESDINSLESMYVGQLVHVIDNDKFFRIKSVDALGSPTSREVVAYTEITSDKMASWDGKQDAITPENTLSPNNIKDVTMNGKLAAYNNNGVLGNSGISTNDVAVKSEMSITDGTAADAGTATIQLKSGTSKKVLTEHQSLEGKVDKVQGKGLSTNDYDNTEKGKVANAIQMPSGEANNKVLGYENDAVAWVDKPQDGEKGDKGDKGEDAVNPFKGYYPTGVSKPATGTVGDYLYAPPSDSQSTATATIWHYDSTQTPPWTDTGIDVSAVVGVEFGSGQAVNTVKIMDETGEEVTGPDGVLSATAGKRIGQYIFDSAKALVKGESANDGDYYFEYSNKFISKNAGEVHDLAGSGITSGILLNKGDTISMDINGGVSQTAIASPITAGTLYTVLVNTNNPQSSAIIEDGQHYEYTAENDITVVLTYNISKTPVVTVSRKAGIQNKFDNITNNVSQNTNDINTLSNRVYSEERVLVKNTDFTTSVGLIRDNGTINPSDAYYYTSAIALHVGEELVVSKLNSSGLAIFLTNGSQYRKLVITSQLNGSVYEWRYIPKTDCQVAITNTAAHESSTTIKVLSGGVSAEINKSAAKSYNDTMKSEVEMLPKYDDYWIQVAQARAKDNRNIEKAKADRQYWLNEIRRLGASHIVEDSNGHKLQGKCGYADNDDDTITDGTIKWEIYDNGVLHIHGYGKMYDFIKGTGACLEKASFEAPKTLPEWYYGFVTPNENGYTNPDDPSEWKHFPQQDPVTYSIPRRYFDQNYGDAINPINGKPYGYAAPWYIYRDETDFYGIGGVAPYTNEYAYFEKNPNGFKYDKVVISEYDGVCSTPENTTVAPLKTIYKGAVATGETASNGILIKFTYNSVYTGRTVTLSLNGETDKPLYYNGSVVTQENKWNAGSILLVQYDSVNDRYNAVDIESGIKYIGMWNFYRVTCESLILPASATYIAEWGVRYSPTMKTLVWGDNVTECEDMASSRLIALETLHLSNSLTKIGVGTLYQDAELTVLEIPSGVTDIPINAAMPQKAINIKFGENVETIGFGSLKPCKNYGVLDIPDGCTTIDDEAFNCGSLGYGEKGALEIHIPSTVTSIGVSAFSSNVNCNLVVCESTTILANVNSNTDCGRLFMYTKYIKVPTGASVGTYIFANFEKIYSDASYDYYKRV